MAKIREYQKTIIPLANAHCFSRSKNGQNLWISKNDQTIILDSFHLQMHIVSPDSKMAKKWPKSVNIKKRSNYHPRLIFHLPMHIVSPDSKMAKKMAKIGEYQKAIKLSSQTRFTCKCTLSLPIEKWPKSNSDRTIPDSSHLQMPPKFSTESARRGWR